MATARRWSTSAAGIWLNREPDSPSVLANRLSARASTSVLLLEAGRDTAPGEEPADVLDTYPVSYYNPAYIWSELRGHMRGRDNSPEAPLRQARILGGGSSLMGMVALRGTPDDYDGWAKMGVEGWGWQDVLPYFRKLENDTDFAGDQNGALHGQDGPVPIRRLAPADWPPLMHALKDHCGGRQIPHIADFNGDFRDGFGALPTSKFADRRASSAICYLDAATRQRPNLRIATNAKVQRLEVERNGSGGRVTGVTAEIDGGLQTFTANEVIVSAGALQSPAMLLRAGIGPASDLQSLGIPVIADLPGVGGNLQNHQIVFLIIQTRREANHRYGERRHTIATLRYSSGIADCPPSDMYISLVGTAGWHALGRRISSLAPALLQPASRGLVSLRSADPRERALIEFDFQSDDRDRQRLAGGVRRAAEMLLAPEVRKLWHHAFPVSRADRRRQLNDISTYNALRAQALAKLMDLFPAAGRPILGSLSEPGVDVATLAADDDKLNEFVTGSVSGMAHHAGTCRMGAAGDRQAVVDPSARVHGVAGLRVVDASIMPVIPRGNTNLPTLMVAEKIAAAMVDGN
jgi:5-(hydroxymethyl)furfural/furfural oxidase